MDLFEAIAKEKEDFPKIYIKKNFQSFFLFCTLFISQLTNNDDFG